MSDEIKVRFWGVRGSVPSPGPNTAEYGGNTPCIEILKNQQRLIFESGTGIRPLGNHIIENTNTNIVHLFISHTHWDHIQGFPFFRPAFSPDYRLHVYGPRKIQKESREKNKTFEDIMRFQMDFSVFPVKLEEVEKRADIRYHPLEEETVELDQFKITSSPSNHTMYTLGYKIETPEVSIVYTADREPYSSISETEESREDRVNGNPDRTENLQDLKRREENFIQNADLLISDAQYTQEEYQSKEGWGHSTIQQCMDLALRGNVENVVFFHHDPERTDRELKRLEKEYKSTLNEKSNGEINGVFAREGMTLSVNETSVTKQ